MGTPDRRLEVERLFGKSIGALLTELYVDRGMTAKQVATKLGVCPSTVVTWCRWNGIPIRRSLTPRVGNAIRKTATELYRQGWGLTRIAEHLGCSMTAVRSVVMAMGELRSRENATPRKYEIDHDYFSRIDTELKAYFLGFIAADGCITWRKDRTELALRLEIQRRDEEIIQKLVSELGGQIPIVYRDRPYKNRRAMYVGVQVYSKQLCEGLIEHGITPRKSLTLQPPDGLPSEMVRHFVRGVFDGDGAASVSVVGRFRYLRVSFSGTPMILDWLRRVFEQECGLSPNKLILRSSTFGELSYCGARAAAIRNYMYPTGTEFGLSRKKAKLFSVGERGNEEVMATVQTGC